LGEWLSTPSESTPSSVFTKYVEPLSAVKSTPQYEKATEKHLTKCAKITAKTKQDTNDLLNIFSQDEEIEASETTSIKYKKASLQQKQESEKERITSTKELNEELAKSVCGIAECKEIASSGMTKKEAFRELVKIAKENKNILTERGSSAVKNLDTIAKSNLTETVKAEIGLNPDYRNWKVGMEAKELMTNDHTYRLSISSKEIPR